jgi:hypothetical protein
MRNTHQEVKPNRVLKWKKKLTTLSVGTFPKSNIKFVEIGKIDTPNIQIHGRSLSFLGTGTSIKSGGVILVCPSLE